MPDEEEHLSPEQVLKELAEIKTKVYLPSSYSKVADRYSELVLYELNNETSEDVTQAFYGVLEAASKNFVNEGKQVKDGFEVMPTKKLFVTTYHAKRHFKDTEQRKKIRRWGLDAANLPYPKKYMTKSGEE